jgi:hypothetical protein
MHGNQQVVLVPDLDLDLDLNLNLNLVLVLAQVHLRVQLPGYCSNQ